MDRPIARPQRAEVHRVGHGQLGQLDHGEQEGSAWNGHFDSSCYHPNFLFSQFGMLERRALRKGNVHSADGWRDVLDPVIALRAEKLVQHGMLRRDLGPLRTHPTVQMSAARRLRHKNLDRQAKQRHPSVERSYTWKMTTTIEQSAPTTSTGRNHLR
jgi:hypothetical protein